MKKLLVFALATIVVVSLCSVFVSAEGTNVAAGKSYTYTGALIDSTTNANNYPDTGNKELTDGILPKAGDFGYGSEIWVGMNSGAEDVVEGKSEIVIDLGESVTGLTKFVVYTENYSSPGIGAPTEVEVLVSANNSQFTSVGKDQGKLTIPTESSEDEADGIYEYTVGTSSEQTARYIKYSFTHGKNWLFVAEVEAYTGATANPGDESEEASEVESEDESQDESTQAESSVEEESVDESVTSTADASEADDASDETSKEDEGLGTGAIVGIVAGAVVILGVVIYFLTKKK